MAPDFRDFISLDSSLTPGVAGALTTSLALPLVSSFTMLKFTWVALSVSFVFSLLIITMSGSVISLGRRCLYCLLNTLIIFAIAFGAYSKIDRPPSTDLIPSDLFALSCEILDKTPMEESNRKLIKSLLAAHSGPQASTHAWLNLLGPSTALAQPGGGQPPSGGVAGAVKGAAPPRESAAQPKPPAVPQASPKDLEAARQYELQQQQIRKEQKRFRYQSTF